MNTANDADARADWVALESLARALFPGGPASVSYVELSVALCTDAHIRALNAEWRGKDAATDVLSVPAEAFGEVTVLGDCVVSVDTAARQARDLGHALADECRVLLAHGIAHLAGMDHEDGEEQARECRAWRARFSARSRRRRNQSRSWPGGVAKKASERAAAESHRLRRGGRARRRRRLRVAPNERSSGGNANTNTNTTAFTVPRRRRRRPGAPRARRADVLVVDLDGTLLNGDGRVTRRVADALRRRRQGRAGVRGHRQRAPRRGARSRPPASTGRGRHRRGLPGVFLQGLDVRAPGGGSLASVSMPEEVVRDAFAFHAGEMFGFDTALTAFCGSATPSAPSRTRLPRARLALPRAEERALGRRRAAARGSAAAAGASCGEGDETSETSALRLETSGVSKLLLAAPDAAAIGTWRPRWGASRLARSVRRPCRRARGSPGGARQDDRVRGAGLSPRARKRTRVSFGAETSDDARAVSNGVFNAEKTDASNELRGSAPFAPLRVVAVGDGENDGMLRAAGVGVALANACEATKRAADHVTAATNERDGVAEAIRKFVL